MIVPPSPPPPEGVNFFVTWGIVEWMITSMAAAGAGVAGWVYHLGGRIEQLERENKLMKEAVKGLGVKIDDETERLESRVDRLVDKIDEIKEELPSRGFVEGQIGALVQRIDRMFDVKLAGR